MSSNSCEFIIGFGFTCPFMESLIRMSSLNVNSPKIISLMPGEQGVVPWPKNKENLSVLVDETSWPINTSSADIIFLSVNTPSKEKGFGQSLGKASNLEYLEKSVREIAKYSNGHTIIVEKSTLPVKTAEVIKEILESSQTLLEGDIESL